MSRIANSCKVSQRGFFNSLGNSEGDWDSGWIRGDSWDLYSIAITPILI